MESRSTAGRATDPPIPADISWTAAVRREIGKVVVGQDALVHRMLICLVTGGHLLIEGVPGLAKTLVVRSLADACQLQLQFQRLQFTPDLLPADVVGTLVLNPKTLEFTVHLGPIFSNLVLADEINRAPAKVQSALLEAMEERAVTIGHTTHSLPDPFLVLATQNPLEHEGTFPLPEAQLDRFLLKVRVTYPTKDEELEVARRHLGFSARAVDPVVTAARLIESREALAGVFVDDAVMSYVLDLVRATRTPRNVGLADVAPLIRCGASPRATVHFVRAVRAAAFLAGRRYALPEDVRDLARDVLRHRLVLSFDAEADNVAPEDVIDRIVSAVPVP